VAQSPVTHVTVRVRKRQSKAFYTSSGVRQGCVLAPTIFCLAIDWIMSRFLATLASHLVGQCLLTWTIQMMRYFLHRIQEGGRQNSSVSTMPQPLWVCTLRGKRQNYRTLVTVFHLNQSPSMDIGHPVEVTDKSVYLGSTVDSTGYSNPDIL